MADVTINNLTGQAPSLTDVFPFSTTGVGPATYKASLSQLKSSMSLNNVENKSSATIRSEITSSNVTTALGYTPYNSTNPAGYITAASIPASQQLAKAWVNFNGTGSIGTNQTIRSQYNISTVNKLATGQYRVTFTSAMTNSNYVINGMAVQFDNTGIHTGVTACWNFTTTYFDLYTETIWIPGKDNAYFYDSELVTVTVFGT